MNAAALYLSAIVLAFEPPAAPAPPETQFGKELKYQQQTFQQWWGVELGVKLDDLPLEGVVPGVRVPYSGHDYPDRGGGTVAAMQKYDRAYHSGRPLALDYERRDVGGHRGRGAGGPPRGGLFSRLFGPRTPGWYGHCNGWTAASIRHAEPRHSVTRNGVVFTPSDIKGLLAEIYMYTDTEFLGGETSVIDPGLLHITLANWLGRGQHPVGMEVAPGEVVVNYPIYTYRATVKKSTPERAEVRLSARYAMNTGREVDKSPDFNRVMYFHYSLDLDKDGQIVGGRYHGDSARIDMLWTPLKPVQGGQKGNERGNPHLDIKEVLAIWRDSVPDDVRGKWFNIDPTDEDRLPTDTDKLPGDEAEATASVSTSGS